MSDIPLHHWFSRRRGFVERTLADLTLILDRSYAADEEAAHDRVLHRLDARVKVLGALVLIVHAASSPDLSTIAAILGSVALLAMVSRVPAAPLLRLWLTVGVLAAMLAIPAMFLTPGSAVFTVPGLHWHLTGNGCNVAAKLILRALTSSTVAAVLVLTTSWQHVLKAMRRFGAPVVAVVLIGMSYRYIIVFLHTATELMKARKSRTAGRLPAPERRHLALSSVGVLLDKAMHLGNEVHLAMQARGYRGEVHVLDEFTMRTRDWSALAGLLAFELALIVATR